MLYCTDLLTQVHINDNFAKFSEALFVADRHAREEVRQRAIMQQKLAAKEKAAKEENLRMMAQRAREERGGAPRAAATAQFLALQPHTPCTLQRLPASRARSTVLRELTPTRA